MPRIVDDTFNQMYSAGPERFAFCGAFALFEYALKQTYPVNGSGIAWPNWCAFIRTSPDLNANANGTLKAAINCVLNNPPMIQKARDGQPQFEFEALAGSGNEAICEALKRIRNNLFHGGKQPYKDRDRQLVEAGLEIIEGFLDINPCMRTAFCAGAR